MATEAVRPRKAQAAIGSGPRMKPVMVDRKMARSCHACGVTSAGVGTRNQMARPTAREIARGISFAPSRGGGSGRGEEAGFGESDWDEEERAGKSEGFGRRRRRWRMEGGYAAEG